MTSNSKTWARSIQSFIDSNFKPFSELIDCRRYSFPLQHNILQRFLLNLDYFIYNYAALMVFIAIAYIIYHGWFSIGFFFTLGFWWLVYRLREKIIAESPTNMCYNVKMTFFLILNITLLWSFYHSETIEFTGYIVIPIIFHAILFEPVLQKKDSVEKQVNPEELDIENNQVKKNYNQFEEVEQSSDLPLHDKMSDEMAQAYSHQNTYDIPSLNVCSISNPE